MDEEFRHLALIQITLYGGCCRAANDAENRQHLLLLDEFTHLLDDLRRTVGIVERNEGDLATVHAAMLVVKHLKVSSLGAANGGGRRQRPAIGHGVADPDLGVGCASIVFLLGKCAASNGSKQNDGGRKRRQSSRDEGHFVSPF